MKHRLMSWVTIVACEIAMLASLATPATAATNSGYVSDNPGYKGWAQIQLHPECVPTGVLDFSCGTDWQPFVTIYYWTGSSWTEDWTSDHMDVYAYPFAPGWTWAWTSGTGWFAIQSDVVRIESQPPVALS
jgi:hypothetical protein